MEMISFQMSQLRVNTHHFRSSCILLGYLQFWHPIYTVVSHSWTYIYECLHGEYNYLLHYDLLVRLLLVILQVQHGILASFQVLLPLSDESLSCL